MQVPNYEWDTFFSELLKIRPKSKPVSPQPEQVASAAAAPTVSPSHTSVPLDPGEQPLPEGWTKDIYEGKPLYGEAVLHPLCAGLAAT